MLKRIAPPLPSLPALGWLVLVWTMLAHASTGAFALSIAAWASDWLDQHAWAGFLCGFLILVIAIAWPRLQPYFPKWLTNQKTVGERLSAIEHKGLPAIRKRLRVSNAKIEKRLNTADQTFNEHKEWMADIQRVINQNIEFIPKMNLLMTEISILISQVDTARYCLLEIGKYLPESDAAKAPFSKRWYDPSISPQPHHLVIEWMLSVEKHIKGCLAFAETFDEDMSVVLSNTLYLHASTWDQPNPMRECDEVLKNQRNKLIDLRRKYANTFKAGHVKSSGISLTNAL
jgi:hypothetical protein